MPSHQLLLDRRERRLQLLNLPGEHLEDLARQVWQARVRLIANDGDQLANIAQALRRNYSELSQMRAQSIHQCCALAHQSLPTTVQQ